MAKKQTRRSISVSRTTYERLKAFCETNNISMSQLVETRVNDFLGGDAPPVSAPAMTMPSAPMAPRASAPIAPRPMMQSAPVRPIEHRALPTTPVAASVATPTAAPSSSMHAGHTPITPAVSPSVASQPSVPAPMTSAAARFAVDPPPPIIKPRQDTAAPKPAEKRPEQIFTF
jgi:hypothetical protein